MSATGLKNPEVPGLHNLITRIPPVTAKPSPYAAPRLRETWETLQPVVGARRWAEVRAKLVQHEADAASWRDTSVNYWREFSGRPNPVDGGPLSLAVTAGGKERRGFDLSASSYTVPAAITARASARSGARGRSSCRRRTRRPS